MKIIDEPIRLSAIGLNRREFFKKAGLAALGLGIAGNTAKADGDGHLAEKPLSRADRLRKERDDREKAMRQWRSFSEDDIRRMRNVYAEDIARAEVQSEFGNPEKVLTGACAIGAIATAIAVGVLALKDEKDSSN